MTLHTIIIAETLILAVCTGQRNMLVHLYGDDIREFGYMENVECERGCGLHCVKQPVNLFTG